MLVDAIKLKGKGSAAADPAYGIAFTDKGGVILDITVEDLVNAAALRRPNLDKESYAKYIESCIERIFE
jgi:hypothetical protein